MKNKKLILFSSFAMLGTIITPISVISCSEQKSKDETTATTTSSLKETKNPEKDLFTPESTYYKKTKYLLGDSQYDNETFEWDIDEVLPNPEKVSILDATIIEWKDGDTVRVKFDNPENGEAPITGEWNIRIALIDTPEKGLLIDGVYKESVGKEKEYAERATEFGKKILPKGSKVKIAYDGKGSPAKSYERIVGFVFFGKNGHYRDYSVEIIKAGLTLPNPENYKNIASSNNSRVEHYELWKATRALEFARKNKTGIWEELKDDRSNTSQLLTEIYKMRGYPSSWNKLTKDFVAPNEENIYKYDEFLKELEKEYNQ